MADSLPSIEELLKRFSVPQTATSSPVLTTPVQNPPPAKEEQTPPLIAEEKPAPESSKIPALAKSETAEKLSEKMGEIAKKEKETEVARRAKELGLSTIELKGFPITPEALTLIPEEQAEKLRAVAFLYTGPELRLAVVDPNNDEVKELVFALEERLKTHVGLYLVSEESIGHALKLYAALPKFVPIVKGVQITEEEIARYAGKMKDIATIAETLKKASVTDVMAVAIAAALNLGSSDIHIEAEEKGIAVRFRVDGILQDVATLDSEQWKRIINRIKLIASLKLNVTDQAQDGRFTIFQKNKEVDVRTSTIPTAYGESVVMRLLNPETISLEFDELGFRPACLKRLTHEIEKPNGMIVTTGPTGSGKTTTLYAILKRLNTSDVKIITLEDPIEYKVEGLNQSQIDTTKDYTFAKGLRSILRQDPDIVMVGEIRDLETAEIAIQASLTGHLLLSTIHTNDAAGAIPRFLSMGVKPFLLAPAINGIMGQRLLRKLCPACKVPAELDKEMLDAVTKLMASIPASSGEIVPDISTAKFFAPKGCDECNNTGFKGRVGAYEFMVKNEEIEKIILSGNTSEYQMRDVAARQGMVSMAQDGLLKALDGITSVDEVKRVVGIA